MIIRGFIIIYRKAIIITLPKIFSQLLKQIILLIFDNYFNKYHQTFYCNYNQ